VIPLTAPPFVVDPQQSSMVIIRWRCFNLTAIGKPAHFPLAGAEKRMLTDISFDLMPFYCKFLIKFSVFCVLAVPERAFRARF